MSQCYPFWLGKFAAKFFPHEMQAQDLRIAFDSENNIVNNINGKNYTFIPLIFPTDPPSLLCKEPNSVLKFSVNTSHPYL